jgi:hypothetical protein
MRNIKVWGGTHANEPLGVAVAESLLETPIDGVAAGVINKRALEIGRRFVDINMNDGYPGDENSTVYETRRAAAVLRQSLGYYAVIDFHDYNVCLGGDNAFAGSRGVRPEILGFLKGLGFEQLIQSDHNALREHVDNSFALDIGLVAGGARSNVEYWRDAFRHLAQDEHLPTAAPEDFQWYSASGAIHTDQLHPRELDGTEGSFSRLPAHIEAQLGLDGPQHWSCWNPAEKDGWWAELCTPINPPDATRWPGFSE